MKLQTRDASLTWRSGCVIVSSAGILKVAISRLLTEVASVVGMGYIGSGMNKDSKSTSMACSLLRIGGDPSIFHVFSRPGGDLTRIVVVSLREGGCENNCRLIGKLQTYSCFLRSVLVALC